MSRAEDLQALRAHVVGTVGENPARWPGGYPDEIELALVDAVFSARAKYGSLTRRTGVIGVVDRYAATRDRPADDLGFLATSDAAHLREDVFRNHSKTARRFKADLVVEVANRMVESDISSGSDFREAPTAARSAYVGVNGCGDVTWRYLRMLLGLEDVKPDTWVMRFVRDAIPRISFPSEAGALLAELATEMNVELRSLDHAIWKYQRGLRR